MNVYVVETTNGRTITIHRTREGALAQAAVLNTKVVVVVYALHD